MAMFPKLTRGYLAEAQLTCKRFVILGTDPAKQVNMPGGANAAGIGVVRGEKSDTIAVGKAADVDMAGIVEVEAGEAITAGSLVRVHGATGKAGVTTASTTHIVMGVALTAAGQDGDVIEVLLSIGSKYVA